MVFTPTSKADLRTAVIKWLAIANDGSTDAVDNANNYNGSEYQGNSNTWDTSGVTDMSGLFSNTSPTYGTLFLDT